MFPNIMWHKLDRTYVQDGINRGRALLGNMVMDSVRCDWLMECFENWEYRQLSSTDDWSANPKHDRYSHLMDAFRYAADFLAQVPYIEEASNQLNRRMPTHYGSWEMSDDEETSWADVPPGWRPSKFSKLHDKSPQELYGL